MTFFVIEIEAQKNKLVFATQWLPQAQFAGYYVARDQGFYEEAGIDIEIISPSSTISSMEILTSEKADIVSGFLVSAIEARGKGFDLVNIAQLSQHSSIMFVSKKSSGINTLNDFNGKKIGIWKSDYMEVPMSLITEKKLNVEWVPILSSVNLFLMGGIDLMTVLSYNEYDLIYLSGVNKDELNTFFMSDYGYDVPEDGLYAMQNTVEKRKNDLRAFVNASLKGWEYAANNKEYTIELVVKLMREAHIPSCITHQRWMLDKVLDLQYIKSDSVIKTQLHPDDFNKAISIMQKNDNSKYSFEYEDFFQPVLPGIRY
ncbi:MAG: ABC transporter substrate-binding protein [Bacteroidota bacterium]